MTTLRAARTHSPLYTYMTRSHEQLRAVLPRLLEAMSANSRDDVAVLWRELDHGLLSHMDAEERFILPAFALVDRAEALDLLRQHGQIREQLLELGVAVDLHLLRFERSEDFLQLLLTHAAREERLLYRWSDDRLTRDALEAIRAHLGASAA